MFSCIRRADIYISRSGLLNGDGVEIFNHLFLFLKGITGGTFGTKIALLQITLPFCLYFFIDLLYLENRMWLLDN